MSDFCLHLLPAASVRLANTREARMHVDNSCLCEDADERLFEAAMSHEDAMMRLLARSADLENRALAEVGRFEEQRVVVMAALERLNGAETLGLDTYDARDAFLGAE